MAPWPVPWRKPWAGDFNPNPSVLVENGEETFFKDSAAAPNRDFCRKSPFSERLALEIDPRWGRLEFAPPSGTVGPSYSAGRADAALILAASAALADAAASAVGNVVQNPEDVERAWL